MRGQRPLRLGRRRERAHAAQGPTLPFTVCHRKVTSLDIPGGDSSYCGLCVGRRLFLGLGSQLSTSETLVL